MVLAPIWELIFHAMQFSLKFYIPISANSFKNDFKKIPTPKKNTESIGNNKYYKTEISTLNQNKRDFVD